MCVLKSCFRLARLNCFDRLELLLVVVALGVVALGVAALGVAALGVAALGVALLFSKSLEILIFS